MRFIDFISVKLTFFLIVGILLGFHLDIKPVLSFLFLTVFIILLALFLNKGFKKRNVRFGGIAMLTTISLGIFIATIAKGENFNHHYSHKTVEKENLWNLKVEEVLKATTYSDRYVVKINSVNGTPATGKILLSIPNDSIEKKLNVDDEILLKSRATEIGKPLNPHQFDYRAYLKKKGITYQLRVKSNEVVKLPNESKTLIGKAAHFRNHIIHNLKKADFGKDELAVIQALLLGQRNDISEDTYNNYKNAGAVHILAVSGLHVGIILILLQFFLRPIERLPKGKTLKLVLIVVLLWGFAFIAGLSPSIVRAVTMFSFVAYAMHLNRTTNTFNIIVLSMFFTLLVKPMFLFKVGFQMSYAAVFAIVWMYPKLQRFWFPENWLIRKIWQLLSVSIAAQLGVLPISLFYFHQFPALFFVSNLAIVPFLGIILGIGLFVIALSLINILPQFLVSSYCFLIRKMNSIVACVAQQEGFVFRDIPFDQIQLILGYLLIFGLVFSLSKPKFKNIAFLLAVIVLLSGWSVYNQLKLNNKQKLILAHQTKNTIFLYQNKNELGVLASNLEATERITNDFKVAERITAISLDSLQNSYALNGKYLFVMDSLGIYPNHMKVGHLLLTQSPKVNLARVIDSIKPKRILVDGSNYKSYIQRWKATCIKKKVPFHYTGEKGAFYFEIND